MTYQEIKTEHVEKLQKFLIHHPRLLHVAILHLKNAEYYHDNRPGVFKLRFLNLKPFESSDFAYLLTTYKRVLLNPELTKASLSYLLSSEIF